MVKGIQEEKARRPYSGNSRCIMLFEQEKEWMKEYASQSAKDITYGKENRHVERIIMPNFFDKRRNDHL